MMAWSDETMEALRRWHRPGTWCPGNPIDDARFCVFIASVRHDKHEIWNEWLAK